MLQRIEMYEDEFFVKKIKAIVSPVVSPSKPLIPVFTYRYKSKRV
jgi:hypothetical protein